jgi:hypothetical protein
VALMSKGPRSANIRPADEPSALGTSGIAGGGDGHASFGAPSSDRCGALFRRASACRSWPVALETLATSAPSRWAASAPSPSRRCSCCPTTARRPFSCARRICRCRSFMSFSPLTSVSVDLGSFRQPVRHGVVMTRAGRLTNLMLQRLYAQTCSAARCAALCELKLAQDVATSLPPVPVIRQR